MGTVTCDPRPSPDTTEPSFILKPVHATLSGAQPTGFKEAEGGLDPLFKLPFPVEFQIGGFHP
jgi:hypothetical protein